MPKLRLLHLAHSLRPESGGTATAVLQAARSQRDKGHEVEIVSLQKPNTPSSPQDLKTHIVGSISGGYGFNRELGPWLKSRASDYDLLIVHGLWQFPGLAAWRHWHREAGGRYMVFPHGMLDPWFNRTYPLKKLKKLPYWWLCERRILRDASAVCFTCEEEQRLASMSFGGYRANGKVVGLGLEAEISANKADAESGFRKKYAIPNTASFILFLGRIHPKKGLENTLTAYARAFEKSITAPLLVIAGPPSTPAYFDRLKKLVSNSGLQQIDFTKEHTRPRNLTSSNSPTVVWLPMIQGNDKVGALHGCEALVLCSHQENFGLVVAEAAAASRPVLITRGVNIWREILSAKAGLVANDTPAEICRIFETWRDTTSGKREEMGHHARQCYLGHFTADAATERFLDLAYHCRDE
ncbi:MAG: glycosyltransferase [Synoicihabitans sp.]